MQEKDGIVPFAHRHVHIENARVQFRQLRQFVIVGRKQRSRSAFLIPMQIFNHRPGNTQTVVGAGAATDFVQNNERSFGSTVQNVGGFQHFHHKRRLPACQIIAGSDARTNAIHATDAAQCCRHPTTEVRHQRNQRVLSDKRAFTRHVRSG